ncbi:MAG TPA: efflux RND transporter periplasmic adaptor subunit, partial [Micropepsaceae bacterium]|nr:efflux RND transporter periplasmic adaptor subunit [Micropepsaceae bacterium]
MKSWAIGFGVLLLVTVGSAGGYWIGLRQHDGASVDARKILYYRNPMGQPDTSPVPKKDSMGMDYLPVYADAAPSQAPQNAPATGEKRVLYYRNPMGQPDTSPVPKKDSMGMDYLPVYEGEEPTSAGVVKISPEHIQQLGVRSEPVEMRQLAQTVQSVGTVQADERRLFVVNTKFDGWIETLNVSATGQGVRQGEPLMSIYAPELVAVQQEYLLARQSLLNLSQASADVQNSARELAEAALQRLRNWDISNDQIERLRREGTLTRTLTLRSPTDGVVLEKMAVAGARVMAGEPLYRIADLGSVWVLADLFEQDLAAIRQGQSAVVTVEAYPGLSFSGKVDFIYPTVTQETRTAKVRIVIENAAGRLKPGMYVKIAFQVPMGAAPVLAVSESAVLDSGNRQIVLIDLGQGRFEPRDVKLGAHTAGYYAVREGLKTGDTVVVGANFLIDAESNLRAALQNFAAPGPAPQEGGADGLDHPLVQPEHCSGFAGHSL